MMRAAQSGGRLVAALAGEPGLARLAEPATPVLLWRAGQQAPVWASAGGRDLVDRLPTALDGSHRVPAATAARLQALAAGLAPRSGVRLERLRWGWMEPPLTFACRLVPTDEGEVLLTAVLQPAAVARAAPDVQEAAPAAPAEERAPRPTGATVVLPLKRGRRFMWRADAEGRFTFVSPDLAEIVGARGADVIGRRWDEMIGHLIEDRDGSVGAAWAEGRGWARLPVGWRDPERERLVPVELSGAPVAAEAGAAPAYRGFGMAYPDRSRAVDPGTFRNLPDRQETPPAGAPSASTAIADAIGAAAVLGKTGETMFNMLRAWLVPPDDAAAPWVARVGPPSEPPREDGQAALTSSEQGALDEIARTLNGADRTEPPAVDERPSAEIVPLPRARLRAEPTMLLDQLSVGSVVLRDGVPLFANRAILERLGFEALPDAVAKGALHDLAKLAPEDAAAGSVSLRGADGTAHPFEARASTVDWGDFGADLILLTAPPAPSAELEALRLDLAARDRRLDEARAALDLAADAVMTLDPAARLLSLSRSAERLFGIAANEVVGDSVTALVEPHDHRTVLACLEALRASPSGTVQQCEIRGRTRDGASIPLAMRAGHAPGETGGFSVAFSDVSHFRLLEGDLREARAAAEEASANRADFLARISHEVRTPLTAITGFAELMLEERFGPLGNERYKGYIRDIRDSGIHVISLVNDLLDLAKATSGADDLHPEPLDLNAVVQQCVALAGPLAGQERTIIRTSFPADLPRVFADERSIRQIVINLLSNAIRFTGAGGQVIVSTAAGGPGEVVLSVRDTGPGMSDEEVETALTPFRQVSSTRRGDGTGLGLPLSKALTEANGGVFVLTSARDLGTLVELRLPVERRDAVAAE